MSRSKLVFENFEKIHNKSVAIIGVGGTGSTVANLFARINIKELYLIDFDIIEEINLERQTLYDKSDIGKFKVEVAKNKLEQFCNIKISKNKLEESSFNLENYDLVIDCSDNFETRSIINEYCKTHNIPWIYSGAISTIGTVYFVHPNGPCFECFNSLKLNKKCSEIGVLNSVVSFVASFVVNIAVDYLVNNKYPKYLFRFNLKTQSFEKFKVNKDPDCLICKN